MSPGLLNSLVSTDFISRVSECRTCSWLTLPLLPLHSMLCDVMRRKISLSVIFPSTRSSSIAYFCGFFFFFFTPLFPQGRGAIFIQYPTSQWKKESGCVPSSVNLLSGSIEVIQGSEHARQNSPFGKINVNVIQRTQSLQFHLISDPDLCFLFFVSLTLSTAACWCELKGVKRRFKCISGWKTVFFHLKYITLRRCQIRME